MANFHITKVIHEYVNVTQSEHGPSYGQLIDDLLLTKAHEGDIVQSFELLLDDREWLDFATKVTTPMDVTLPRKAAR